MIKKCCYFQYKSLYILVTTILILYKKLYINIVSIIGLNMLRVSYRNFV